MNTINAVPFMRGQGCFNTFIIIDLRQTPERYTNAFLKAAHQLLLEVGDDDVLILRRAQMGSPDRAVYMDVLEPDGSFASFCGNGARVVAAYLESQSGPGCYSLVTSETSRALTAHGNGLYSVAMGQTVCNPSESPFVISQPDTFISSESALCHIRFDELPEAMWYFSQTGEPHLITFDAVSHEQLDTLGIVINDYRYRSLFPQGMSLNVVEVLSNVALSVFTFERGVNRITQACGTGSTCSVAVASEQGLVDSSQSVTVRTSGGEMVITYDLDERTSVMTGPAVLNPEIYELIVTEERS